MRRIPNIFKTGPVVFAVGRTYQIMVPVRKPCLMWVQVGETLFADSCQGILRSDVTVHRITVPMEKLDEAKSYTVICREIIERKPYFTETKEPVTFENSFRPIAIGQKDIRIYHIADAHSRVEAPVRAASWFAEGPDILVMNGDIPNHSGETEYFDNIYLIADQITGGRVPVVFTRGNHDCRGFYAEHMGEYIPMDGPNTWYTFRLGPIWGVVLDCGEDKPDGNAEYGNTVCFHEYRMAETEFLKEIARHAMQEYEAPGVAYKFVVVHAPFTRVLKPPFDIEQDIYAEWARILREQIKPDVMMCGHIHDACVYEVGGEMDHLGQACTVVIGAKPLFSEDGQQDGLQDDFIGAAFTLHDGAIHLAFTNASQEILEECDLKETAE